MRLDNLGRKLKPLGLSIALGLNMALLSATGAWAQQYEPVHAVAHLRNLPCVEPFGAIETGWRD